MLCVCNVLGTMFIHSRIIWPGSIFHVSSRQVAQLCVCPQFLLRFSPGSVFVVVCIVSYTRIKLN